MTTARELRTASRRALRDHIVHGHPVDPRELEGWVYRGTSLGLPDFVAKLSWKTFQKTFYRDPTSGRLLGWNVRLEQDGIDAPSRPKLRRGRPVTEWHYEVIPPEGVPMPRGFDRGLVIDYGRADNPPGYVQLLKDPLVALAPGSADELLGVSYAVVAGRCIETPTYFTLEREARIDFVPYDEAPRAPRPLRLSETERRWAEELFAAILGTGGTAGTDGDGERLPPFEATDRSVFWRHFDAAPAPLVRAGLRPMLHTLVFLPLVSGFRKPFYKLAPEERARFLAAAAHSRRYFVRQAVVTLKMLACFAYFDDPRVRAPFEAVPPLGGAA
ncbi:MAG: hypothetical protein HY908_11520 [Myxococcales bacterium]|nr:hypothetical protein [Myxococcales bacterium]